MKQTRVLQNLTVHVEYTLPVLGTEARGRKERTQGQVRHTVDLGTAGCGNSGCDLSLQIILRSRGDSETQESNTYCLTQNIQLQNVFIRARVKLHSYSTFKQLETKVCFLRIPISLYHRLFFLGSKVRLISEVDQSAVQAT